MNRPFWQRLLGPLAPAAHLGIFVDGDTVYATAAVPSILGPREADEVEVALGGRPVHERVADLVARARMRMGRLSGVTLGIPAADVCLETRRLTPGTSPAALKTMELVSTLGPAGAGPGRAVVQVQRRVDPHSGAGLHCVIACRDTVLDGLEATLPHADDVTLNLEPATVAALRWSLFRHPVPDPEAIAIRVLAGPRFCAAFLLHGTSPLVAAVAPPHEAGARPRQVLAMIAGLSHHARAYLELEVREIAAEGLSAPAVEVIAREVSGRVEALEGPGVDGQAIATGLALGACGVLPAAVHLHRQQRERRRSSRASFPWRDLVAGGAAVAAMMFSMEVGARRLHRSIEASRSALAGEPARMVVPLVQLEAERDGLAKFLAQWIEFDDRPISWTRTIASLAQVLPDTVRLIRIDGKNPVLGRTGNEPAPFTMDVVTPEKNNTLGAILSDPYLKRAFPHVEVTMALGADPSAGAVYTLIATGTQPVPDNPQEAPPSPSPGGFR